MTAILAIGSVSAQSGDRNPMARAQQFNLEGLRLFQQNNYAAAAQRFRAAMEANPADPEYPNNAGVCYLQSGRFQEAREMFEQAARMAGLPLYHFNSGLASLQLGEYPAAIASFSRAVQMQADYFDAWKHLGNAHFNVGDLSAAESAWKRASALQRDAEVETNLGTIYLQQNKLEQSHTQFEKALSINPRYYLGHFNMGVLLQKQGRPAEAERHYRDAARVEPRAFATYYNLAIVQTQQGKKSEAIASLEKFLEVAPPSLFQQIGDARKRLAELRGGN